MLSQPNTSTTMGQEMSKVELGKALAEPAIGFAERFTVKHGILALLVVTQNLFMVWVVFFLLTKINVTIENNTKAIIENTATFKFFKDTALK